MGRYEAHGVAFDAIDAAGLGVANANRLLQHRCKYWLEITGGTADDLKHLGCGCLLLQCFG